MAICDGAGRPLGFSIHGADTHETKCVSDVLESIPPEMLPIRLFGDKAYDSQGLQDTIALEWDIDFHAPIRKNNKQSIESSDEEIQEGKKSRWKVERLFSWLKSFRRTNTRWEYHPENFLSWIFLAATMIIHFRF